MRVESVVLAKDGSQRAAQRWAIQHLRHASDARVHVEGLERRDECAGLLVWRPLAVALPLVWRRRVLPLDAQLLAARVNVSV